METKKTMKMSDSLKKEVSRLIKKLELYCKVNEFEDYAYWDDISETEKLSLSFIRHFKDKVYWCYICQYQKLSEAFIREMKEYVEWSSISAFQKLSEKFMKEFENYLDWENVAECQNLSAGLRKRVETKIDLDLYEEVHRKTTKEEKIEEMKAYAERHVLVFDGKYLYAFREHDGEGKGMFNKTISYKKGKYYRDWHLDMRKEVTNSFGLGVFPKGNTPVRVKVEDWGVCVNREDGKCRVWGFEVL